jgi:hypothetical protein
MDEEELINCVLKERVLWELKSSHYRNRNISIKLWAKIGNDLNVYSK